MRERILQLISSNMGTKIISLMIAIVLWIIVLGSRDFEATKEVPIEVLTAPDLVVSNDYPATISFRLSGPKAFLRAVIDREEPPIKVNLRDAKPGLATYRFFSDNIRVPIGVKVLSINPTAVLFKLEKVRRHTVPVRVQLIGEPPEGFTVESVEVNPKTVTIRGARSRIAKIDEVNTVPIDVSDLRQPMEREASLDLLFQGVELDSPVPTVKINVQPLSANFRIKNVGVKILTDKGLKSQAKDKTVTVLVRADQEALNNLDRTKIFGVIDLRGESKGTYTREVTVEAPEKIGVVQVIPDKLTVTLK